MKGMHNPDNGRSDLDYVILRKVQTLIIVSTALRKKVHFLLSLVIHCFGDPIIN